MSVGWVASRKGPKREPRGSNVGGSREGRGLGHTVFLPVHLWADLSLDLINRPSLSFGPSCNGVECKRAFPAILDGQGQRLPS